MAVETTTNYGYKKPDYTEDGDVLLINENMDEIDGDIHDLSTGKKSVQTAKNDPTAAGTSLTFIATISQNTNGEITATKCTVADMGAAGASSAGTHGLVPAPAAGDNAKFLRGDKTWATPSNTTYSAGTGLSLSGTTFNMANTAVTAGTYGPSANVSGTNGTTINVPQITVDAQGRITSVTNRVYTSVNTDTNTTYSAGTNGGLSLSGTAFSLASSIPGARTFSDTTDSSSTSTGAVKISGGLGVAKNIYGLKVYNAVWNDYAECRESNETEPGRVVRETIMGVMVKTEKRRMRGCKIISDTFGTCMGETEKAKTPIGVAGRVLAYPARDKSKFYLGAPVCSGPNGTVDVMSRLEAVLFPECIIGTVSEIPRYEKWIAGTKENPTEINVDGRIWIYVR